MNGELIAELILIGLRRLAELNEAYERMRAGGPEVSEAEVAAAGLAADAAILKAKQRVADGQG
jgi:hypothetical protein